MANPEHLKILKQGVEAWNEWRKENTGIHPNLLGLNLSGTNLSGVNFYRTDLSFSNLTGADLQGASFDGACISRANLHGANLKKANLFFADLHNTELSDTNLYRARLNKANLCDAVLCRANLCKADLTEAFLFMVDLKEADLRMAILNGVNLRLADLSRANLFLAELREAILNNSKLIGANLVMADLRGASLLEADVHNAIINGCNIYGISVWGLKGEIREQKDLIITPPGQPEVTVDNIKVAQFIYLLLENKEIRDVLDTLTAKAVLILGRFTDERKKVLDSLKDKLRERGYLPILFDFEKPGSRNLTETIKTLAGISRFVIADITDAKSIIQELMAIVPHFPSIPVQPLLLADQEAYAMFESLRPYPWVCAAYRYDSPEMLLANLEGEVIGPAERKVVELKGSG